MPATRSQLDHSDGPPARRRHIWALAVVGVIVLAGVAAFLIAGQTKTRDDASYGAGWSTGLHWAQDTMANLGQGTSSQAIILGTTTGPESISDSEILGICPEKATYAEHDLVYYYTGGQMNGHDIKREDFISGCINGARSVVGRRT